MKIVIEFDGEKEEIAEIIRAVKPAKEFITTTPWTVRTVPLNGTEVRCDTGQLEDR